MVTVRQSGGNYGSLNAACAAGQTVIDIDQAWTVNDTTKVNITNDMTITVSGGAKHPGYYDTSQNHYRLVCTGGHTITLNGAYSVTIDGIAAVQAGTGSSDEVFRCVPGIADVVTVRNSIMWCSTTTGFQDCIYTGFDTSIGVINIEQCVLYDAMRGGIHSQNAYNLDRSGTININSCTIYNNGAGGTNTVGQRGGGIYLGRGVGDPVSGITINIYNTISVDNHPGTATAADYLLDSTVASHPWNISRSVDSDNSIATVITTGANNLPSRTPTDSSTPGAGNWVVFESLTGRDLRLKSNAENDAQDVHATATAHGLTIPTTDIIGTARPQNTNYDIGALEIVSGGGIAEGTGSASGSATALATGKSIATSSGSSTGVSTVVGVSSSTGTSSGLSVGSSTVTGIGQSLVTTSGLAPGSSTVSGVGTFIAAATPPIGTLAMMGVGV